MTGGSSALRHDPDTVAPGDPRRRHRTLLLTALVVLAVDIASKAAASKWLRDAPLELPGPLDLQLSHNPGVAFGVGSHLPLWVVLGVTAAVASLVAAAGWWGWFRNPWAAGMVVGGALGNVIDRAQAGTVVDMLHTGWWPTFNVADVAVVCGATLLAISLARASDEPKRPSGQRVRYR